VFAEDRVSVVAASAAAVLSGALSAAFFIGTRDDIVPWTFWERRLYAMALVFAVPPVVAGCASLWLRLGGRDSALALVACGVLQIAGVTVAALAIFFLYDPFLLFALAVVGGIPTYLSILSLLDNEFETDLPLGILVRRMAAGLAVLAFSVASWPVGGLFLAALSGWLLFRRGTRWWAEALAKVLLPTWIGACAAGALFVLANTGKAFVQEHHLRGAEMTLLAVRGTIERITTPSWLVICALIVVLAAASAARPDLRILHRAGKARDALAAALLTLTACSSFTFFSTLPLDDLARTVHERQVKDFHANVQEYAYVLRTDWDHVGSQLAAEALHRAITRADSATLKLQRDLLTAVQAEVDQADKLVSVCDDDEPGRRSAVRPALRAQVRGCVPSRDDFRRDIVTEVARTQGRYPVQPGAGDNSFPDHLRRHAVREQGIQEFRGVPRRPAEWTRRTALMERQGQRIGHARARRDASEARAREVMTGARQLFVETVGLATPELKGLAGHYVDEMIGSSAETFFQRSVARWYGRHPEALGEEVPPAAREAMIEEALRRGPLDPGGTLSVPEAGPLRVARISLAMRIRSIATGIRIRHQEAGQEQLERRRFLEYLQETRSRPNRPGGRRGGRGGRGR
jgi:hypothetical protein